MAAMRNLADTVALARAATAAFLYSFAALLIRISVHEENSP